MLKYFPFIILFNFLSINSASSFESQSDLFDDHCARLALFENQELNIFQSQLRKILLSFSQGKLTDQLLDYFSKHPTHGLSLKKAADRAEILSRRACGQFPKSIRHSDDEVDAVRHVIWAGLLTMSLGQENALNIMSMQENRPISTIEETLMDLSNNEVGSRFAHKNRDLFRRKFNPRKLGPEEYLMIHALKSLNNGTLIVQNPNLASCVMQMKFD